MTCANLIGIEHLVDNVNLARNLTVDIVSSIMKLRKLTFALPAKKAITSTISKSVYNVQQLIVNIVILTLKIRKLAIVNSVKSGIT